MNHDRLNLLLVFVKIPVTGKVKTRLAKSIGNEKALKVYKYLVDYTYSVVRDVEADVEIWFSDSKTDFKGPGLMDMVKKVQTGGNLGERMSNAFREGFTSGYHKVVIIGSDCPEILPDHIEGAFKFLDKTDVVIGPSFDGGYYLLGMKKWNPNLFLNIDWSTDQVFRQTRRVIEKEGLNFSKLERLNDIDTVEDLNNSKFKLKSI
jgi:uncharacterized protein